jgi:hypothetical protein
VRVVHQGGISISLFVWASLRGVASGKQEVFVGWIVCREMLSSRRLNKVKVKKRIEGVNSI